MQFRVNRETRMEAKMGSMRERQICWLMGQIAQDFLLPVSLLPPPTGRQPHPHPPEAFPFGFLTKLSHSPACLCISAQCKWGCPDQPPCHPMPNAPACSHLGGLPLSTLQFSILHRLSRRQSSKYVKKGI